VYYYTHVFSDAVKAYLNATKHTTCYLMTRIKDFNTVAFNFEKTETMSQLTLNSIPSLDAIQRPARTKDRRVKHPALHTQHNFHSWHNMDQTVFMQMLCIPPMQPRIRIRMTRLILPDIEEYGVRTATYPSS
jgi:hypothetical protein